MSRSQVQAASNVAVTENNRALQVPSRLVSVDPAAVMVYDTEFDSDSDSEMDETEVHLELANAVYWYTGNKWASAPQSCEHDACYGADDILVQISMTVAAAEVRKRIERGTLNILVARVAKKMGY